MTNEKIHFIGIGGIGMSGIALLLMQRGIAVSGSDSKESERVSALRAKGAEVFIGHRAENVKDASEIVVSSAIREDNPELVEAKRMGIPRFHRSEKLAWLVNSRRGITIAGTHGKTTTTSMAATVMSAAGVAPSYVVGGIIKSFGDNSRANDSDWIVIEADESDGSLVNYKSEIAVLTNVELDHADFYKNLAQLDDVFCRYLNNVIPGGTCIYCADDPGAKRVVERCTGLKCVTYGFNPEHDISARKVTHEDFGSRFEVCHHGNLLGEIHLRQPGLHNISNALAVVGIGLTLDLPFEAIAQGLNDFEGVGRRFQTLALSEDHHLVDDYAHHPSEIKATLAAARLGHAGRIVAVFQPHRYSRVAAFAEQFGHAFGDADVVILADVYAAGEDPINGIDSQAIANYIRQNGNHHVQCPGGLDQVEECVMGTLQPGDLILTMGAGDLVKTAHTLADRLSAPV
ncbi:UDP-N-acetylmuramate--L-alanine ligase [candidate division BRC1 bacterium HGW-BRC1-1]|jgi:UDP-N-acetylmuramate--alanine ligase|nr:MAG: UDP-N-acetylmuramate--L-alanine ligase [candidate division BRC1 bacterium HGW-BRC1-1]